MRRRSLVTAPLWIVPARVVGLRFFASGRKEKRLQQLPLFHEPLTPALLRAGNDLFCKDCKFVISSSSSATLPPEKYPEIVFAGRSNVGKSSLMNSIMKKKDLVLTSRTPGRTQTLNFFEVGSKLYLVDFPGYGFASAPLVAKERWLELSHHYLTQRKSLKMTCLLIDTRRGIGEQDTRTMEFLNANGISHLIVLTKVDLLGKEELLRRVSETKDMVKKYSHCSPIVHVTSSKFNYGLEYLRVFLMRAVDRQSKDQGK